MKSESVKRIESVSILVVSCNGIAQVFHVDAYLVLASCLESHFSKRESAVRGNTSVMRNCFLAAVICGAAVCDVSLVVLEPRVNSAAFLLHLATKDCNVPAVVHDVVPVFLEHLPDFHALGI